MITWGGTVQLDCKLERAEKNTFALTKAKVDKYLSDANNQPAEGILSYEEYKGITDMSELLSQTMTENSFKGLSNLTLSEVAKYDDASIKKSADKIIKAMNFEYQPYFCESIVKDFSFSDEEIAECMAKTAGMLKTMMKDEGVQALSMIKASGNEWGMWESIYLVGRNFDSEESIVIYFDLVHEI